MIFRNWVLQNFPFLEDDFDALTDYELFCKMVEYMKKSLDKIKEYQDELNDFREELDSYKNYFDNLDVQEEIDNKLDEMAESGELTDIIAQYLGLAGVLAYDTLSDLENAENVVNGSICVILGKDTYNDGKTAFYKIRNILNTDVIDNDNLIAIINNNQLVGEKIINYDITQINQKLVDVRKNIIFLGDSYGQNNGTVTGWADKVNSILSEKYGYTIHTYMKGASGFVRENDGVNTLVLLQNQSSSFPDKSIVTDIVVVEGYNDQSYTQTQILEKIEEFCDYCKETYPNANITIGCVGWTAAHGSAGSISDLRKVKRAYSMCGNYGACYMENIEYTLHNYSTDFESDNFHPSDVGTTKIANNIVSFILGGGIINSVEFANAYDNKIYESQQNNICNVFIYGNPQFNVTISTMACDGNTEYELGDITPITVKGQAEGGGFYQGKIVVHSTSGGYYLVDASIKIGDKVIIRPYALASTSAWLSITNVNWVQLTRNNWTIPTEDC